MSPTEPPISPPAAARRATWLQRWRKDHRGVSAVEFALIAPMLLLLFCGMGELGQALMAQRRVSHIASTIGDLTAQTATVHDADLNDIYSVANIMMSPLPVSGLSMRITSITAASDANKTPKVDWSQTSGSLSKYTAGATVTVPAGLLVNAGDSVILAETTYTYHSPVRVVLPNGLNFNEQFYFRPRKSAQVAYSPS